MPPLRAVVFDLGHTLWNYAPREESRRFNVLRLHRALEASLGAEAPSPAELDRALGVAAARWIERWQSDDLEQPPSEQLVGEALQSLAITPAADLLGELTGIFFGMEQEIPVVEPDTLATIAALDTKDIALGCVTNTITLEAGINDALRRLGLHRYLRSVVVSSAMGYRKPHPSLFRRALEELAVAPDEALFVGDRLIDDVSGARGIGMRAVLTHQYRQEPVDGAAVKPDAVIGRLSELPRVIEEIEGQPER